MGSSVGKVNEDGLGAMEVVSTRKQLTEWYPLSYLGLPHFSGVPTESAVVRLD